MRGLVILLVVFTASNAAAQRWQDATARCFGVTAEWSNEVDVADLDGDGNVDILVANGGNYDTPGTPVPTRVWRNLGEWSTAGMRCADFSAETVQSFVGLARTIKAVDVDRDGDLDIITGGAYQSQLKLYVKDGAQWADASSRLPQQATSVHDVEPGDVDGDGDLDLLLSDDATSGMTTGGRTKLYVNDGAGTFTDATATHMPDLLVKWSWDVELADIDGDWDLDALISCKRCTTSYVFANDGTGHFTDVPDALPHFANNYEFEPMDIDGDGDLDLATLNDGPQLRDHILVNDGTGKFVDGTATRLSGTANPPTDDNAVIWLDADADGDADLFVGSLNGADRLLLNNGAGLFTLAPAATPNDTPGTLSIAMADLDGDNRLDLVQAQGEAAFPEKLQLASSMIAVDTSPPKIVRVEVRDGFVVARIHDHLSPVRPHDWQRVWIEANGVETPLVWYGEYLWRATAPQTPGFRVCAKDRAGMQACSDHGIAGDDAPNFDGGDVIPGDKSSGGCCDARGSSSWSAVFGLVILIVLRRRRRMTAA
jgi:hypothetical protein